MAEKLPGASVNRNGPLTSIAQYRGLFGDRVNTLVDGVRISQAGPNSMDSPLSYIAASQLDNLTLYRGIAPVSSGIETIGGTIEASKNRLALPIVMKLNFMVRQLPAMHITMIVINWVSWVAWQTRIIVFN